MSLSEADLRRVTPEAVERLLLELGWTQELTSYEGLHMWRLLDSQQRPPRIFVPQDVELADFAVRIDDALTTLSSVYSGSPAEWYERFLGQAHDVIRFELQVVDSPPGTVGVEDGLALHDGVRNALNAAAKSKGERRPYFGQSRWQDAATTMKELRFGQPAVGSYVVRVLAVPSEEPDDAALFTYADQRAELRAFTEHLLLSLQAAESGEVSGPTSLNDDGGDTEEEWDDPKDFDEEEGEIEDGDVDPLLSLVDAGVSADLCSALFRASNNARVALTVAVEWSADLPPSPGVPTRVAFSTESLAHLGSLGLELKESQVWPSAEVSGIVENLRRPEGDRGVVTVVALRGTAPKGKKVRLRLDDESYDIAIEAHRSEASVEARGVLTRVANRFWLDSVTDFRIEAASKPAVSPPAEPMF